MPEGQLPTKLTSLRRPRYHIRLTSALGTALPAASEHEVLRGLQTGRAGPTGALVPLRVLVQTPRRVQ